MPGPQHGYGMGGGVDVNALFESQTIDQLWTTLASKRKEAEMMQLDLRQLVGDNYQDLLSASDMIVGMGDICDYLIESYEESSAKHAARRRGSGPATGGAAAPFDVRRAAAKLAPAMHQVRSWLYEGRYVEAAMAAAELGRTLAALETVPHAGGGYLVQQIARVKGKLAAVPDAVLNHACSALEDAHDDLAALPQLTALCSQMVVALALLTPADDVHAVLQRVVAHLTARLRRASTSAHAVPEAIYKALVTLHAVRQFVYKVFVERSAGLTDAIDLTPVATLSSTATAHSAIMDLAPYVSSSEYFDPAALAHLHFELPIVTDARALLARWQDSNAAVVQHVLQRVLQAQGRVKGVIAINERLRALSAVWQADSIQARPPQAWMDAMEDAVKDRLVVILNSELEAFIEDTKARLGAYVEDVRDGSPDLDPSPVDDQTYAGALMGAREGRAGGCEEFSDPCLPLSARSFLVRFHEAVAGVLTSLGLIAQCVGRQKHEQAAQAFQSALARLCTEVEQAAASHPAPATGLVVQGVSRAVAYAAQAARKARGGAATPWVEDAVLKPVYKALHGAYMTCFVGWVETTSAAFGAEVAACLTEEYWGPEKQTFERIVWSRWEHRDGEDKIISHLPGGPTAALLAALQRSTAATARIAPSLLRKDVVHALHKAMLAAALPHYTALLESRAADGTRLVCQPALWQLLFDVKLLGVVCDAPRHGAAAHDAVVHALLDSEHGIDPVYWSTERAAFEAIFAEACEGVALLLATHGVPKPPTPAASAKPAPREANYVDFIAECDRFPTLHLAPLSAQPSNAAAYSAAADAPAVSKTASGLPGGAGPAGGPALGGIQGLQQLQSLGAGLQQQFKGMKYFGWR
eukprot:TRINITY_DN5024_c2_g1_i1.p1 TRINITY_DN5024_c2_g1~~TRINITY_DN5024_c2_g1_i1.p1  ORF type:complete len:867 (+),score=312.74 TRINITY_DN5024_c2_g1_i1:105-2705(+)